MKKELFCEALEGIDEKYLKEHIERKHPTKLQKARRYLYAVGAYAAAMLIAAMILPFVLGDADDPNPSRPPIKTDTPVTDVTYNDDDDKPDGNTLTDSVTYVDLSSAFPVSGGDGEFFVPVSYVKNGVQLIEGDVKDRSIIAGAPNAYSLKKTGVIASSGDWDLFPGNGTHGEYVYPDQPSEDKWTDYFKSVLPKDTPIIITDVYYFTQNGTKAQIVTASNIVLNGDAGAVYHEGDDYPLPNIPSSDETTVYILSAVFIDGMEPTVLYDINLGISTESSNSGISYDPADPSIDYTYFQQIYSAIQYKDGEAVICPIYTNMSGGLKMRVYEEKPAFVLADTDGDAEVELIEYFWKGSSDMSGLIVYDHTDNGYERRASVNTHEIWVDDPGTENYEMNLTNWISYLPGFFHENYTEGEPLHRNINTPIFMFLLENMEAYDFISYDEATGVMSVPGEDLRKVGKALFGDGFDPANQQGDYYLDDDDVAPYDAETDTYYHRVTGMYWWGGDDVVLDCSKTKITETKLTEMTDGALANIVTYAVPYEGPYYSETVSYTQLEYKFERIVLDGVVYYTLIKVDVLATWEGAFPVDPDGDGMYQVYSDIRWVFRDFDYSKKTFIIPYRVIFKIPSDFTTVDYTGNSDYYLTAYIRPEEDKVYGGIWQIIGCFSVSPDFVMDENIWEDIAPGDGPEDRENVGGFDLTGKKVSFGTTANGYDYVFYGDGTANEGTGKYSAAAYIRIADDCIMAMNYYDNADCYHMVESHLDSIAVQKLSEDQVSGMDLTSYMNYLPGYFHEYYTIGDPLHRNVNALVFLHFYNYKHVYGFIDYDEDTSIMYIKGDDFRRIAKNLLGEDYESVEHIYGSVTLNCYDPNSDMYHFNFATDYWGQDHTYTYISSIKVEDGGGLYSSVTAMIYTVPGVPYDGEITLREAVYSFEKVIDKGFTYYRLLSVELGDEMTEEEYGMLEEKEKSEVMKEVNGTTDSER